MPDSYCAIRINHLCLLNVYPEWCRLWHRHVITPSSIPAIQTKITAIPASLQQPRLSVEAHLNCGNNLTDTRNIVSQLYCYDMTLM